MNDISIIPHMRIFSDFSFTHGGYLLPSNIDGKPLVKDELENRINNFEKLKLFAYMRLSDCIGFRNKSCLISGLMAGDRRK